MTRHKKPLIQLRSFYQWHRYAGLIAALFVIIIAVTGVMLNHTGKFELDKTYVKTNWLLNYYGISAPEKISSFTLVNDWVSQWDKQIYLNEKMVYKSPAAIIGAVNFSNMIVISQQSELLAFTTDGDLIERVTGTEGLPSGIEAIGITDNTYQLAVRSSNGIFTTNEDFLFWQAAPSAIVIWSDNTALPDSLHLSLLERYRGQGLNLERVLLDLHSGRLFGDFGIYFTDFIALLMVFLALSGVWLWTMRTIKQKKHKRH